LLARVPWHPGHLALVLGGTAVLAHPVAGAFHRRRDVRWRRSSLFRSADAEAGRGDQAETLFHEAALGLVDRCFDDGFVWHGDISPGASMLGRRPDDSTLLAPGFLRLRARKSRLTSLLFAYWIAGGVIVDP
jgi:hypothetical protein